MASVTNSNAKRYRCLGQEEDGPGYPVVDTLREKILKNLVQKQLTKYTSLEEQLHNQRKFIKATSEVSVSASTSGLSSYKDYRDLEKSLNIKQILYSSGLTHAEVQLLLNENSFSSDLETSHAKEERLKAIEDKLLKRQHQLEHFTHSPPEQFSGAVPLTRHDYEEECNVVSASADTEKLTSCLVRLQPHNDASIADDHPINHIKAIADELFPEDSLLESRAHAIPEKHKLEVFEYAGPSPKCKKIEKPHCIYLVEKPKSFWDLKEIPKVIGRDEVHETNKVSVVPRSKGEIYISKHTTTKDCSNIVKANKTRPFVLILNPNELVSFDVIKSNKKTVHELCAMEKFKDYSEGKPSSTLYIKNMSCEATPKDLASLMGHFECNDSPKIQYRILNGRMKGQAFVTFPNKEIASHALNLCNGYILYNKPLVIEFGKN